MQTFWMHWPWMNHIESQFNVQSSIWSEYIIRRCWVSHLLCFGASIIIAFVWDVVQASNQVFERTANMNKISNDYFYTHTHTHMQTRTHTYTIDQKLHFTHKKKSTIRMVKSVKIWLANFKELSYTSFYYSLSGSKVTELSQNGFME